MTVATTMALAHRVVCCFCWVLTEQVPPDARTRRARAGYEYLRGGQQGEATTAGKKETNGLRLFGGSDRKIEQTNSTVHIPR
jgi:hypothetical protein